MRETPEDAALELWSWLSDDLRNANHASADGDTVTLVDCDGTLWTVRVIRHEHGTMETP